MIPKVIHYCWFGGKTLPEDAKNCIESWKKYCPDYEIKEWNENNFDLNSCLYVKQAYEEKKWAFVSDYARFWILSQFGGLYFDTDVEIIKPIDELLDLVGFMCVEKGGTQVAPGLGIGFEKNNDVCLAIKQYYEKSVYRYEDGSFNEKIVLDFATEVLEKYGYSHDVTEIQTINNIVIFPYEYFCPIDYKTGVVEITPKTYSIHWYSGSWISEERKKNLEFERKVSRVFGKKIGHLAERIYSLPRRVIHKFKKVGLKGVLSLICKKMFGCFVDRR